MCVYRDVSYKHTQVHAYTHAHSHAAHTNVHTHICLQACLKVTHMLHAAHDTKNSSLYKLLNFLKVS